MERIHKQSDHPVTEIQNIAVVISEPSPGQRHTGLLYRVDESDPVKFLHLAWQCDLRSVNFETLKTKLNYDWVAPKIHELRLQQLAAICDAIANENQPQSVRYGFTSPVGVFDKETKRFLLGPTEGGLTCASFVLSVFDVAQLQLVKYSGWPLPDSDDYAWQESVLNQLEQYRLIKPNLVSQEHIDCVRKEVGNSVRYRPEQVAAACAIRERRPIKYRYAKELGKQVVNFLRGHSDNSVLKYSFWDRFLRWLDRVRR